MASPWSSSGSSLAPDSTFSLDVGDDGVAVVTIATPGRAVNVLGTAGLQDLEDLMAALEAPAGWRGLVLTSAKPGTFLVGADLDELERLEEPGAAREWVQRGQQLLERWRRLAYPTAAAIRGAALGGGLEVALACTYRVASDEPATVLGLPEVRLGLLPALGGTWALPHRVGLRRGLELLLTGRHLDARAAIQCGLIDERVPPAVLDRAARAWLAGGRREASRSSRDALVAGNPMGPIARRLVLAAARRRARRRSGSHYPALPAIVEAVAAGCARGRQGALRVEAARFGELAVSRPARNLIWLFRESRPQSEPEARREDVRDTIGVVGAGFMGAGVAALAARRGFRVRLHDSDPEALGSALRACRERRLLAPTPLLTGFTRAELVIEAVTEDLDAKRAVLAAVEAQVSESAILASNTSTLPIAELARPLRYPNRLLGLHFFSPVDRMRLVEIVRPPGTADPFVERAREFARSLGRVPIVVRDGPGFYTSRALSPYLAQGIQLLREGWDMLEVDAAGRAAGFAVGPLELLDEVGIDVAFHAAQVMADAFPGRMAKPRELKRLLEAGRFGRKRGQGFYDYKAPRKLPDPEVGEILGIRARARGRAREENGARLLWALVAEAVRCLDDGTLSSARDGDVGAVLGIGFPPFLGGPFRLLAAEGGEAAAARLAGLAERHGEAFSLPTDLVQRLATAAPRPPA